ncbi:MAG TPA: hypothetical protein VGW38_18105 [Chloroflexota bacterium]|nr:hypothetical protein [Chloroflexota bacterium]
MTEAHPYRGRSETAAVKELLDAIEAFSGPLMNLRRDAGIRQRVNSLHRNIGSSVGEQRVTRRWLGTPPRQKEAVAIICPATGEASPVEH